MSDCNATAGAAEGTQRRCRERVGTLGEWSAPTDYAYEDCVRDVSHTRQHQCLTRDRDRAYSSWSDWGSAAPQHECAETSTASGTWDGDHFRWFAAPAGADAATATIERRCSHVEDNGTG